MARPASPPRRKPRFRERHALRQPPAPPPTKPARPAPPPPRAEPRLHTYALPTVTREQALYGLIVLAGFLLRIWDAGSRAMHGDEAVHAWLAWNLYNGTGYQYDPVYHGPLQFPVTALFYFLFGPSNTSGRLLSILCGSALVGTPYFLRRELGRAPALLAAGLVALSPAFLYVSRLERDDSITSLMAMLMAVALFGYLRTRRTRYIYLGAAVVALSLAAMENTYITVFVFGSFLIVVLSSEYLASTRVAESIARWWRRTGSSDMVVERAWLGALALVLLAFVLTVLTGFALPVPLVLALIIILLASRQAFMCVREDAPALLPAIRSVRPATWLNALTIILAILFLTYSTFGTNLRGIWDWTQPIFNSGSACPGNSFPLNPCRKDIIGGLFYWLSQHQVHRGGQPWFYYSLLYGLYEQIAVIFGVGGMIWFLRRPSLFTSFLTYWAVLMFGVYSWAGEKFPWLTIHALLPFYLLAAMFIVDLVRRPGWIRLLTIVVAALLVALELHSTYVLNYQNGADPVEMMVYVQSSPDTPRVASNILSLSNRVSNGNDLHVTIDSDDTWPFAWYLRDMPNVAYPNYPQVLQKPYSTNPVILVDESHQAALLPRLAGKYSGHRYRLRWWFPEDYKTLTWPAFFHDAVNPGYWSVIGRWMLERRPFGPKQAVWFYYYVKNGLASPY